MVLKTFLLSLLAFCLGYIPVADAQGVSVEVLRVLDEGDDYIIDQPNGASVNDRGIIAISELRQAKVLVFNENGEFLRSIGRRGNGPGEFQMIYHIELVGDHLFTLDFQLQRISVFDVNTGEVLNTRPYKDVFDLLTPASTASASISGVDMLLVAVADQARFETGNIQPFGVVTITPELKVVDDTTINMVDLQPLLDGDQGYSVSYFRPINNFSFLVDEIGLFLAPYLFDGSILKVPAYGSQGSVAIVRDPSIHADLSSRIFKDRIDRDALTQNRAIIGGGGSSPWGAQYYFVPRHSLRLFKIGDSLLHLFSEYDETMDAYALKYSFVNSKDGSVSKSGKAQFRMAGNGENLINARRLNAVNSDGIGFMMYLDEQRTTKFGIVKVSITPL